MEWSVLVVQKIQLETTCIFSCLPFGQDFKDCKDTSTAARASSHVEQVFSVNCTVSSVPAVCLKLEQTGWLHENAWVSWEEKKTGLSLAAQLWAACATRRDKLKCSLACSTRTIKLPTRVMFGTSDATFCCYFSFTPSSLLTKLRHKNVRSMSFTGGVRKYCYSEQQRTKSVPEPICRSLKSLHIVIKYGCQNLMSLMAHQQHEAVSEWKLFVTL